MRVYSFALLALGLCLASPTLKAQQKQKNKDAETKKEETVIIKKNGNGQTTVEIKNGEVFINGEKVAEPGNNGAYKKIIIDSDKDFGDGDFFKSWDSKAPRKPMLGVITNSDKQGKGAYIQRVTPGSAARDAGLKEGDIITKLDDKTIADPKALVDAIESHEAGDKVAITYERNGKTAQTNATLSKMVPQAFTHMFRQFGDPDDMDIPNAIPAPFAFDINDGFAEPTPKLGISAEDRADESGVRVLDVKPNSVAAGAGIQKDDIITKLGDENISSVDELQSMLHHSKTNEKIKLQYQRNGKTAITDIVFPKPTKKKDL